MLIAAMVLGLLVGIGEFCGAAAAAAATREWHWLEITLIPLGVIAAVGGFCAVRKPNLAMALLFSSAIGNFVVGIVAGEEMSVLFLPTALLALAGAFVLSKKWGGLE